MYKNKEFIENHRLKNNLKNLNLIDVNNEINNKKLTLRKKKLNKFLNEKRYKKIENNNILNEENKGLKLNDENDKLKFFYILNQIEIKSNNNNNEPELINNLEIIYYSLNSIKDELENLNIFNEIVDKGLIKILHEKIIPKYLNNLHIIYLVTLILSVFIEFIKYFLYDDENNDDEFEKMQNYFLSQNNYIQNYKLIFEKYFNDKNILNNLCIFFSIIIFENNTNLNIILNENFLNLIVDNFSFDEKNIFYIENKLQFISNFENKDFIEKNSDLCLKIQNIIIKLIFQFQEILKKNENLQLLAYIIKINGNLSYSSNETIINNFFDYEIIQFILDLELDEKCNFLDFVLIFFGNLLCNNIDIVRKLYNYGIYNMLINIIKNNKYTNEEREKSFWCLNNFHIEKEICIEIFKNIENVNSLFEFMKYSNKYNFNIFHEINITLYLFAKNLPEKFVLILMSQYNLINISVNKLNIFLNNNMLSYYEFIVLSGDLTNLINLLILNPNEQIKNESLKIIINLGIEDLIEKIILTCYSIEIDDLNEEDQEKIKSICYLVENIKDKIKKFESNN